MGSCQSLTMSAAEKEQERISREIEKTLVKPKSLKLEQSVLLLGPGESGKSTVLKQMRMMGGTFTKEELAQRKLIINSNILNFAVALRDYASLYVLDFSKEDREICDALIHELEELLVMGKTLDSKMAGKLKIFWKMKAIKMAYKQRDIFHLPESAKYFFDNLDRIAKPNYEPTHLDVVHIRMPTQGVVQVNVTLKNINLTVCDCGGQRSERRKWHHFFDDNNAVLFVAAVSEFDQKLVECSKTNRMEEAINLFAAVFSGKYFNKSAIILFLNKIDIFREKLKTVKVKDHFDKYEGENSYKPCMKYFRHLFREALNDSFKKRLYAHDTCAISDQVQLIINTVVDTVVQENLKDTGMI